MIIDIHVHPHHLVRDYMPADEQAAGLLAKADHAGVDRIGLLGIVRPYQSEEEIHRHNTLTIDMVKACPQRLFGLCYVDPSKPADFITRDIDRCVRDGGLIGIKLEIDVNCRDRRLDLVMQKALEYDIPVLHHSWHISPGTDTAKLPRQQQRSEPPDIRDLALRFPQVRIIMAHLTGCGMRGVLTVKDLPNVYIDTSGSLPQSGIVEYAVEHVGADRLLYGSDMHGRDFSAQIARITGADLTDQQRDLIFYKNAMRVFKLN